MVIDPRASERALVARAKKGDPSALESIARAELPRVERMLVRLLGPRQDLEDLVQTVFVELCKSIPGFRGDSKLSTFVGGITVRVARRAMRPPAWFRKRGPMPEDPPSPTAGPERVMIAETQIARVRDALDKISSPKRVAFLLWALDGMTVADIAQTTGASVAATRSRIYYAQKELRRKASKDPYLKELLEGGDVD